MFSFFKRNIPENSNNGQETYVEKLPSEMLPLIARKTLPGALDLFNPYLGEFTTWQDWKDWKDLVNLSYVNKQLNKAVKKTALELANERSTKLKEPINESKRKVSLKLNRVRKLMGEESNVRSVTIGKLCYQSNPCKHTLNVTYKNGIKKEIQYAAGDVIQEIYKNHASIWERNSWLNAHFKKYDKSIDKDTSTPLKQYRSLVSEMITHRNFIFAACVVILIIAICSEINISHSQMRFK